MFEGVGEVILAADDVADVEIGVVGARCHVIGGDAVAAEEREVFDVGWEFRLVAENRVVKCDRPRALTGNPVAKNERFACVGAALALFWR